MWRGGSRARGVVRARVRTSGLGQRLRYGGGSARGVEHLDLLRDSRLGVPRAHAARLGHLLRQRKRSRHLRYRVTSEKRDADLGKRVGGLREDGLVDGLLDPGHDAVLVHVLRDLLRRRHRVERWCPACASLRRITIRRAAMDATTVGTFCSEERSVKQRARARHAGLSGLAMRTLSPPRGFNIHCSLRMCTALPACAFAACACACACAC